MVKKFTNLQQIFPNNLRLENVSKDFLASNLKKTGFDDILGINNYLMGKNDIV